MMRNSKFKCCLKANMWQNFSKFIRCYLSSTIPKCLHFDRELNISTLPNGIKVASEYWPSSLATISVFINCGSRNESEHESGTGHFLEHLHFKGTSNRTRNQLELDVENMGGQLNAYTSRESTSYSMTYFKQDMKHAVEIIGDMLLNSVYHKKDIEVERDTIFRELLETQKNQMETLIENAHQTIYPHHQMGKPILGSIFNIKNVTQDMIVNYHRRNYVGKNIIICAAGDVNHKELCEIVFQNFGNMPSEAQQLQQEAQQIEQQEPLNQNNHNNKDRPVFSHNCQVIEANLLDQSDKADTINIGIFQEAPSWSDPDYYALIILQRILGEKSDSKLIQQLMEQSALNPFQKLLCSFPNIYQQSCIYTPYSDTGMFGNFYNGPSEVKLLQDVFNVQMKVQNTFLLQINEAQLQRAKNRIFMELSQHETGMDISQAIGNQLLFLGRRVSRSQQAKQVQDYSLYQLNTLIQKIIIKQLGSITVWGQVDKIASYLKDNAKEMLLKSNFAN